MPSPSSATSGVAGRSDHPRTTSRRTSLLLVLLAALLIAWPLSRRWLAPNIPPRPKPGADLRVVAAYYLARIKANPADADAYLEFCEAQEKAGLYNQASEQLTIARALGAPDAKTSGPLGRCWMKLGRTEQALPELEKAAKLNPDSHEAALNLAQLFAETGEGDRASEILGFFLKHHPDLTENARPEQREAVERLMVACVGLGEAGPALQLSAQLIRLAPNEPDGYAVAGRCYMAQKKWSEAALSLDRAAELAPDNPNVRYAHGVALKHLPGKIEAALKEWQAAASQGSLPAAYEELGAEYLRRKDYRHAAIGYLRAATLTESDPELYRVASDLCARNGQTDLATLCRARAAQIRGQYPAAQKDFETLAQSANPRMRHFGLEGAIDCFRAQHQAKEYLAFIEKVCASGSADDEMRLADAYGELADNARRVEHLRKALARDPSLAGHVHHELGVAAINAGRRDDAEQELETAIRIEPQNTRHYHTLVGVLMDRRSTGDRLQRAVRYAEKIVELAPDSAEEFHLLGTAYTAAGQVPKAIQAFQRSIDLQPGYGPAYLDLGKLYARIGEKERAEQTMHLYRKYQAFDLEKQTLTTRADAHKTDGPAQVALGDFYARAKDYSHAAEQYRKAARLMPADQALWKKLERAETILGMAPAAPAKGDSVE